MLKMRLYVLKLAGFCSLLRGDLDGYWPLLRGNLGTRKGILYASAMVGDTHIARRKYFLNSMGKEA